MKKLTLLAAVLGLAVAATAAVPTGPFKALGYDANLGHVVGRMPLAGADLDLGIGLKFDGTDDGNDDNNLQFGVSGFYLLKQGTWGPVSNYLALGGVLSKLPVKDDNIKLTVFGGFQPEITLLERFIVSTRFGASVDLMPAFVLQTAGQGIDITGGASFKLLF